MKFIIAIEPATEASAWGVVVPDLPGCFSAGDTLDEAMDRAKDAIDGFCRVVIEDGGAVPVGRSLAENQANTDYAGWIWAIVEVPIERYLGPAEKINITLPRLLLARVDSYAAAHGETRSGLLARAVTQVISGG